MHDDYRPIHPIWQVMTPGEEEACQRALLPESLLEFLRGSESAAEWRDAHTRKREQDIYENYRTKTAGRVARRRVSGRRAGAAAMRLRRRG